MIKIRESTVFYVREGQPSEGFHRVLQYDSRVRTDHTEYREYFTNLRHRAPESSIVRLRPREDPMISCATRKPYIQQRKELRVQPDTRKQAGSMGRTPYETYSETDGRMGPARSRHCCRLERSRKYRENSQAHRAGSAVR